MKVLPVPTEDEDFVLAAMTAWNSLSLLLDEEAEASVHEDPESFKNFYMLVMTKLLEETEEV